MVWNLPPASSLRERLRPALAPYLRFSGLEQRWAMFAPTPDKMNLYLRARVTLADGTEQFVPIGRMDTLSQWDRLIQERARKLVETVWNPKKGWKPYYPQIARWAAHRRARDPANPPVQVTLEVRWSPIPRLPDGLRQEPLTGWRSETIYTETLSPRGR